MIKNCPQCGKEQHYKTEILYKRAIKDNRSCRSCCQKGKKHSEESKRKISNSLKGHEVSNKTRDLIRQKAIDRESPSGWTLSEQSRKNQSIGKGGNGILDKKFSRTKLVKWAKLVKERDNYICQHCHLDGLPDEVDAHHIVMKSKFPQYAYDVDNGQTLCKECHRIEHYKTSPNH